MKICIIGSGYVGLVTGAGFAEMGNDVVCVDNDLDKIDMLNDGKIPIYEPHLLELIQRNTQEERLKFTTDLSLGVKKSLFIFIAVGTPSKEDGQADLSYVFKVAEEIGRVMDDYKIIIIKSTVPVGTMYKIREIISKSTNCEFDVVSNPEFLKEGGAVEDFLKPDRVIIGTDNVRTAELLKELYSPFVRTKNPVIVMDICSAEFSKYVANAMLASRISFMNEMANLCERIGADIDKVREAVGADHRIGSLFLFPGIGYGGSCFPKDLRALINTAKENDFNPEIINAIENVNKRQKLFLAEKILAHYKGDIQGKTFALWGLSFKPNTDDTREAPAFAIIEKLLEKGAKIRAYDPAAIESARRELGDSITYGKNQYDVLTNANGLILCTEWGLFRKPDFNRIKETMKNPVIFDGRNLYSKDELTQIGFTYYGVGKP